MQFACFSKAVTPLLKFSEYLICALGGKKENRHKQLPSKSPESRRESR